MPSCRAGSRAGALDELVDAYAWPALRVPPAADRRGAGGHRGAGRRGMALAVVSNTMRTPGRVLKAVLDRAGLLAPFAVLTFSDECGIRKPDPEIFLLTLRGSGSPPRRPSTWATTRCSTSRARTTRGCAWCRSGRAGAPSARSSPTP